MRKQVAVKSEKTIPVKGKAILIAIALLYASVFLARHINMLTADLGRHLANGANFIENHEVLSTNFYSYTQPDFPAINHHWASGVLFYGVQQLTGFTGLSVFYVLCVLGAMGLFIVAALTIADSRVVFATAVFLTPLITARPEVRPEGISFLMLGLFFYVLLLYRQNKLRPLPMVGILCTAQLIWVNCHIFFFMGFMLTGFFILDEFAGNRNKQKLKYYFLLVGGLLLASLCNPFGLEGLLVPLTIFNEYGYAISENQSIGIAELKRADTLYTHFKFTLFLLAGLTTPLIIKKQALKNLYWLLPLLAFAVLGYKAIRAIPLLGLVALPALAFLLTNLLQQVSGPKAKTTFNALAVAALAVIGIGFINGCLVYAANNEPGAEYKAPLYYSPVKALAGLGLYPNLDASAKFFTDNKVKGPVFNDYDIGGYLIYYLRGKEKVFVDNRPEAYSSAFFKDIYIPMQTNPEKFREVEGQYHFNCIWFYMREESPWAQQFLWWVMRQPDYAPVFSDGLAIIFLKRNEQNAALIRQFEIPASMFSRAH